MKLLLLKWLYSGWLRKLQKTSFLLNEKMYIYGPIFNSLLFYFTTQSSEINVFVVKMLPKSVFIY